jgi:hypothetical protein
MITAWNGHRDYLHLSAFAHPGDAHPPRSWVALTSLFMSAAPAGAHLQTNAYATPAVVENDLLAGFFCQPSSFESESRLEKNSFLTDRHGNVIENKGPSLKARG